MPDVLERRVVLEVMSHHGVLRGSMRIPRRRAHHLVAFLIFIIHVLLAHEIFGAFVLVGSAIL